MAQQLDGEQEVDANEGVAESLPPIVVIVYFHKAIRLELERIHCTALSVDKGGKEEDFDTLVDRYHILRMIYEHHSQAEDEVLLPALDARVKNVAHSYSLEHMVEHNLFNQMSQLLSMDLKKQEDSCWKEFICCTEAMQTTLCQHLFKEENQVLPLLMQNFTFEEQAGLVWQFMGNIPIHLMEIFLPWLSSCLSDEECQRMVDCVHQIVPAEALLQQVFSEWFKQDRNLYKLGVNRTPPNLEKLQKKRDNLISSPRCPLNDLLHWHKAIKGELREIAEVIRTFPAKGTASSALKTLTERLDFLSKVWSFHSSAEERFVFPAIGKTAELSSIRDHALDDKPCSDALRVLEGALKDDITSIDGSILAQAEVLLDAVENHFFHEETELLPLASKLCTIEEKRTAVYESLRSMPLIFLRRALPWIVAVLSDREAKDMLMNIRLAAPQRDSTLVALLTVWACEKHAHILELLNSDCTGIKSLRGKRSFQLTHERPLKHCRNEQPHARLDNGYLGSSVGNWGRIRSGKNQSPIDQIFQVHKAIRKDLEYLDVESVQLLSCTDEFLGQFSGRFYFLRGLYCAHSHAEDSVVFPALETKKSLHNVSHSYIIDHRQEETLFKDIADVLSEFSLLVKKFHDKKDEEKARQQCLAAKLQRMCKAIRVCLDQHLDNEESELWPLFDEHFSVKEQEKVMARVIGSTGAEVIQALLPWVGAALTEEEQSTMMEAWQQATRNTMFQDWLSAWWENNPFKLSEAKNVVVASSSTTDLQVLADYLSSVRVPTQEKAECSPPSLGSAGDLDGTVNSLNSEDKDDTFKPGWPEIFKLNQEELEAAVRKVSSDTSLDPRQKSYLMQNLMTSRWMAAQQKLRDQRMADSDRTPSFADEGNAIFGCKHYKRNCKLRAACCGNLFTCRLCHDDSCDHTMDRYQTKEMMCMKCLQVQPVGPTCSTPSCNGYSMGSYYCKICKFFNNDDREIYHCPFCNICRVGSGLGRDFFHCLRCNGCMNILLQETHVCREKSVEISCPICCEFIFDSVPDVRALPCGHFMHSDCFRKYTVGHYTCPICWKALGDMNLYWGLLDALLAAEQLPEEYQDREETIFCNDCEKKGRVKFHWMYHKCPTCGSYNTKTI